MRKTCVQYTPVAPLYLIGRIDATVAADRTNQMEAAEGADTSGLVVNILTLSLTLPG